MKLIASLFWLCAICTGVGVEVLPPSEPTLVAPPPRPTAPPASPKTLPATPAPVPVLVPATPPPTATPRPAPMRFVRPPTPGQLLTAMSKQRTGLTKALAKATAAKKRLKKSSSSAEKAAALDAEINSLEVHSFYLRHREHVLLQKEFKSEPLGATPILFDASGLPYWIDGYGAWRYDF